MPVVRVAEVVTGPPYARVMDGRTGGDGVVRPPLHTPGLAGYLLSWLVSVLAFAILLPLFTGVAPGDYTVELSGYYASDPDTLDSDSVNGRVLFLAVSQLRRR